jgi:hypothetical protein
MSLNHWQIMRAFVVCLCVGAGAGVGTWATPVYAEPSAGEVISTAAADDDMIKLLEQLVKELDASGTDCDLATKKFNAFLDANAETLPAASKALDAHLATLSEKDEQKFAERISPIMQKLLTMSFKTCATHDDFKEANQSFDLLMSGQDDEEQDLGTTDGEAP